MLYMFLLTGYLYGNASCVHLIIDKADSGYTQVRIILFFQQGQIALYYNTGIHNNGRLAGYSLLFLIKGFYNMAKIGRMCKVILVIKSKTVNLFQKKTILMPNKKIITMPSVNHYDSLVKPS
jgi:hypothetical protein